MKFETFTSEVPAVLPETDNIALLHHYLCAALAIADNLKLAMVGIYLDQAIHDVEGQGNFVSACRKLSDPG